MAESKRKGKKQTGRRRGAPRPHGRYAKPDLEIQTTTLWDYPSQHYGKKMQGEQAYVGATPSYIIWNLLQRYTKEKDLVVDPMCGSGTTLDVARDLNRRALGYDIAPYRDDIFRADARKLPLENGKAHFVFIDPPYSTHIRYSDASECIGKLDAAEPAYYEAMEKAIAEAHRVLRDGGHMAVYVCDSFKTKQGLCPIGFRLYALLEKWFAPVDIVAVTRRNRTLMRRHYHTEAIRGNYFLRGFNYLFIMRKEAQQRHEAEPKSKGRSSGPKRGSGKEKHRKKATRQPSR